MHALEKQDLQRSLHSMEVDISRLRPRSMVVGKSMWEYLQSSGRLSCWANVDDVKLLDGETLVARAEDVDACAFSFRDLSM